MLTILTLTKTENAALEDFRDRLLRKLGNQVVLIRLFGSKARGDSHKESDIDVLIVLRKKVKLIDKERDIIAKIVFDILTKHEVYLSLVVFSLKEYRYLSSFPTNFMYWAQKEGIDIWAKTPSAQKI